MAAGGPAGSARGGGRSLRRRPFRPVPGFGPAAHSVVTSAGALPDASAALKVCQGRVAHLTRIGNCRTPASTSSRSKSSGAASGNGSPPASCVTIWWKRSNKWRASAELSYNEVVDTRTLRGGPALRWHDYLEAGLGLESDASRRTSFVIEAEHAWATDDDSWSASAAIRANLRPTNRLLLAAETSFDRLSDQLQYVTTAAAAGGARYVLSHIDQDTWSLTLRVNLALTPDLTLQYYGSPFISTGRYTAFKRATDTLAERYQDRFHLYGPDEIALGTDGSYVVTEAGAGSYSFANPDFSFRQFRSNLVLRWEYRPGSSVYAVWSQGRTDEAAGWDSSFRANWKSLWSTAPDNVFLVKLSHWFSP